MRLLDVVRQLVDRYGVRYVVAEAPQIDRYAEFLSGRVIWRDERFGVFMVG